MFMIEPEPKGVVIYEREVGAFTYACHAYLNYSLTPSLPISEPTASSAIF